MVNILIYYPPFEENGGQRPPRRFASWPTKKQPERSLEAHEVLSRSGAKGKTDGATRRQNPRSPAIGDRLPIVGSPEAPLFGALSHFLLDAPYFRKKTGKFAFFFPSPISPMFFLKRPLVPPFFRFLGGSSHPPHLDYV